MRNGTGWSQQAWLKASNNEPTGGDLFGHAVAISGDTIVVGAYGEDSAATGVNGDQTDNSAPGSGAAYVFVRNGSTWTQESYLKASNTDAGDRFGWSVGIAGDTILVGAPWEDSAATGVNGDEASDSSAQAGAAYVFVRSGSTWSQEAYLKASNTEPFSAPVSLEDQFGHAVAISGGRVLVGAPGEASHATGVDGDQASNFASRAGAAYVFARVGTTWSQAAYLKASNTDKLDEFGTAVSLSGSTAAVGAPGEDSKATGVNGNQSDDSAFSSGAAYVFVDDGGWSQQAYVKASNTEPPPLFAPDSFGNVLAIDGDRLLVGAPFENSSANTINGNQDDNSFSIAGAGYYFGRGSGDWSQLAYVKPSNMGSSDYFAYSVALSGDTFVAGAPFEESSATGVNGDPSDDGTPDSGAAYAFIECSSAVTASEFVRVGSPPNPSALRPAISGPPRIGSTWDPVIDHSIFLPGATLDILGIGIAPLNFPSPYGTVLASAAVFTNLALPSTPFAVAIPGDCSIAGAPLFTQGASWDGASLLLTNALDVVLGSS